jgi:hypothetical protein
VTSQVFSLSLLINVNKILLALLALLLGSVNGEFGNIAEDFFLPDDMMKTRPAKNVKGTCPHLGEGSKNRIFLLHVYAYEMVDDAFASS